MDGGGLWAAVQGVTGSRTQLSDFTFTFHFHALEKEMATHSSVLAWRIPGMGEPGGLPSMGSHRVRQNWSDLAVAAAAGKTTRPLRYDINQITYDYTVEVTNRFKWLDLIECLKNYGQRFTTLYCTGGSDQDYHCKGYWNYSWAISNTKRWCCESAALNMPANLENSAVATWLEKVSFHFNLKERQCQKCSNYCTTALISHTAK